MAKHALLGKILLEMMDVPFHISLVKASHMLLHSTGWGCVISPEERQYIFVNSYTIYLSIKTVTFFKSDLGKNILKLRVRHLLTESYIKTMVGKKLLLWEIYLYSIVKQFPSSVAMGALSFFTARLGLLLSVTRICPGVKANLSASLPEHCRAAVRMCFCH